MGMHWGMDDSEESEEEELEAADHAEQWKKLLADTRTVEDRHYSGRTMTVGQATAWTMETLYGGDDPYAAHRAYRSLGTRILGLVEKRAAARLAGDAPPDFPSAENVDEARREQVVQAIVGSDAEKLPEIVAALSMDESLALVEVAEDHETLNVKLSPIANRVAEVRVDLADETIRAQFAGREGTPVDRAGVEQLLEVCRQLAVRGVASRCGVSRQPCLGGVRLSVTTNMPERVGSYMHDPFGGDEDDGPREAIVSGTLSAHGISAYGVWQAEPPKDAPDAARDAQDPPPGDEDLLDIMVDELDEEQSSDAQERQADFWEKVKQLAAGEGNVCQGASVWFQGMPAREE